MNILHSWIVLDTNIWIFGLRQQPGKLACAHLLQHLNKLQVVIPRQVLRELEANLTTDEMHDLFRLFGYYPTRIDIRWEKTSPHLMRKYQQMGCKLGDAAVASQIEAMAVNTLISENRDFLEEIQGLPFRILSAEEALEALVE